MGLVWPHTFRTHHTRVMVEAERTDGCHPDEAGRKQRARI